MKKTFLPFLCLIILFATACKKSGSGSNNPTGGGSGPSTGQPAGGSNYIKTATVVSYDYEGSWAPLDSSISTYSYDGQNRPAQVLSIDYNLPNGQVNQLDTVTYAYGTRTTVVTDGSLNEGDGSRQHSTTTYFLNASGTLADSTEYTLQLLPAISFSIIYRLSYDPNSYLVSMGAYRVTADGDSLEDQYTYAISNGNTTAVKQVDATGNTISTETFTFSNQTTTTVIPSPGPGFAPGQVITGHPNAGLVTGFTLVGLGNTQIVNTATTLDSQGRVTKIVETSEGHTYATTTYTYY